MIVREKGPGAPSQERDGQGPGEIEKKPKADPSGEDDIILESVPKDDKDDIQLQKAIELLKTGDIFKNLPVKEQVVEKKEKAK